MVLQDPNVETGIGSDYLGRLIVYLNSQLTNLI